MSHPWRAKLYGLALVLASLTISIGLGEIALRFISIDQYYVWPPGMRHIFRPEPEIMPGIEGESRFYINEHGLRGDPFLSKQTYRILAIGGSTTECLYLDEVEAWPYLFQELLNAKVGSEKRIWVGNVGISGRNTRNHILQMKKLTSQYPRIDAVLLLIGVNDFLSRLEQDKDYHPFPGVEKLSSVEYQALMDRSFSVYPRRLNSDFPFYKRTAIWLKLRALRNRSFKPPPDALVQDDDGKNYVVWRQHRKSASSLKTTLPDLSAALEEYARNVNRIIEYANDKRISVIFVTQPYMWRSDLTDEERNLLWMGGIGNYQQETGHEYYTIEVLAKGLEMYNQTLLAVCRKRNIQCIDLESRLPKDTSVFYDDVHLNESGCRKVANVISEYLWQNMQPAFQ